MALARNAVSPAIHDNIVPRDPQDGMANPVHGMRQLLDECLRSGVPIERAAPRVLAPVSDGDGVEAAVSRLSRLLGPLALVLAIAGIGALLI